VFDLPADSTVNRHVRLIAEEAEIDKYPTYHCSRHTYAVLLLSNDVPIYTVSKLMGHDDVATTEIYANVLDKTKETLWRGCQHYERRIRLGRRT
jgi:site-specific recombinase XerD